MDNHKRVKKVAVYDEHKFQWICFQFIYIYFLTGKLENFSSSVTTNHLIFWKITPNFWYHKIAKKEIPEHNSCQKPSVFFFFFQTEKVLFSVFF
jgi:hypothetical protein